MLVLLISFWSFLSYIEIIVGKCICISSFLSRSWIHLTRSVTFFYRINVVGKIISASVYWQNMWFSSHYWFYILQHAIARSTWMGNNFHIPIFLMKSPHVLDIYFITKTPITDTFFLTDGVFSIYDVNFLISIFAGLSCCFN